MEGVNTDSKTNEAELSEQAPAEVYAGANFALYVGIDCADDYDLAGTKIQIVDQENKLITETEWPPKEALIDGKALFTLPAPMQVGKYTWKVLFCGEDGDIDFEPEEIASVSFIVKPHLISMSTWGIPSPVEKGSVFSVNIGAACCGQCSLAGLSLHIENDDGQIVATGALRPEVKPKTNNTYWTELQLTAPDDEAVHRYVVKCAAPELVCPHAEVEPEPFMFRTAPSAELLVTVIAVTERDKDPIEDAYVMLGLIKGTTGKDGKATVKVPKGVLELTVLRKDYITQTMIVEVTEDMTLTVPLVFRPQL